jgi:CheY-like chemotaxis protein
MKRILVVDDKLAMLELMRRSLASVGYSVTVASTPETAVSCSGSETFDLVVTDYRMPQMNGRELIAAMKAVHSELKSLVVSGTPPDDGDDYVWWTQQVALTKPFTARAIRNTVALLIGLP